MRTHIADEVITLLVAQQALEDEGPRRPADLFHLPTPHLLQLFEMHLVLDTASMPRHT